MNQTRGPIAGPTTLDLARKIVAARRAVRAASELHVQLMAAANARGDGQAVWDEVERIADAERRLGGS